MAYVSLYRKYRSQTFDDVMGQEHVTKTLQNAIRLGKVAHAYLFCGTRGTGKTTTARLLAKALNCQTGPTPQPCNVCPACISITQGSAMDIIELDAASHRGIGDIKDINENVKYPPMELRYKIFIIDEAHQLSSDAKDAFLKTLEEPPAHAVFILATTEPQSIPITIRSRCQQFDFRRGSLRDIRERLRYVTENEGVKSEEAALDLVAANADGSWRDSLSLLEQVLAYTDGTVTVEDVNAVLGTVNQDFLFSLGDTLAAGDEVGAFEAAAKVVESGKDVQQLLKSVAHHFRNLLFASVTRNIGELAPSEEIAARFREQASKFRKQTLLRAVEIFSETEHDIRYSDHHRLLLELALLKVIEAARTPEQAPAVVRPAPVETPAPRQPDAPKPAARPEVRREPEPKPSPAPLPTDDTTPRPVPSQQKLPEFDRIKEKWNAVLQHIKSTSPVAYGLFREATPASVRDGKLVLQFRGEGQKNLIEKETTTGKNSKRWALANAIERVFGVSNVGVICEVESAVLVPPPAQVQDQAFEDLPDPFEVSGQATLNDILEIFPNSELIDE